MEWIPNQPLFFGQEDECNQDEMEFVQIVDNTDDSQFQLKVFPCISAQQLLSNPNFDDTTGWDIQSNWSFGTNSLCANNSVSIVESTDIIPEGYWKIILEVSSILGFLDVFLDGNLIGKLSSFGTYELYGFSGPGGSTIELIPNDGPANICFSSIEAYPILTNLIVPVYDKDGVYQTEISYNANPEYFKFSDDTVVCLHNKLDKKVCNLKECFSFFG